MLAFRRRFFAAFAETGLLQPGSDPLDGIYSGGGERKEQVTQMLPQTTRWASYEAFCLSPPIREFYEERLAAVYLHKRKIIRFT